MKWKKVKVSESCTLARRRGSEREQGQERVDSTVKEGFKEVREGKQREPPKGK